MSVCVILYTLSLLIHENVLSVVVGLCSQPFLFLEGLRRIININITISAVCVCVNLSVFVQQRILSIPSYTAFHTVVYVYIYFRPN
jgi:hypothetical protein